MPRCGFFPLHCSFWLSRAPSAFAATKVVTDADNGKTVEIKMGDVLEVRLSSNPSTGFMWYVHKQSTALLKLTSQSETESTAAGRGTADRADLRVCTKGHGDGRFAAALRALLGSAFGQRRAVRFARNDRIAAMQQGCFCCIQTSAIGFGARVGKRWGPLQNSAQSAYNSRCNG